VSWNFKRFAKVAESGFRKFFGVISTSDFTLTFQYFDDETILKFSKFSKFTEVSSATVRHFRLKVPRASKFPSPINFHF